MKYSVDGDRIGKATGEPCSGGFLIGEAYAGVGAGLRLTAIGGRAEVLEISGPAGLAKFAGWTQPRDAARTRARHATKEMDTHKISTTDMLIKCSKLCACPCKKSGKEASGTVSRL